MIFIAGHHDTGKSTLAKFLVKNGFVHVETGDVVRQIYRESESELSFGDWARQNGHNFDGYIIDKVRLARDFALKENKQDVVVTGNRQIEGVNRIRQSIEPLNQTKHILVYMEAEPEILFQRHQQRPERRVEEMTLGVYKKEILGYDKEMGVERIKEMADFVLCNNCDTLSMYSCFSNIVRSFGYQLTPPMEGRDYCPMRRK